MNRGMRLTELADGLFPVSGQVDRMLTGMTADSRTIHIGDAFIAVPGLTAHGLDYLKPEQAEKAGIVLFEPPAPAGSVLPLNALPVLELRSLQGALADRFFRSPSKAVRMVGVTGTNGKTSTVQLIAQAYGLLGKTAGTIGTLGVGIYGQLASGERTTPDVIAVHKALADMREAGAQIVAMEVSSHALDQGRVDAVAFETAVFSNLTLDHLDYHGSMQNYFNAKAKLFDWPGLRHAIINIDDDHGQMLIGKLPDGLQLISTSSCGRSADLTALAIRLGLDGMHFSMAYGGEVAAVDASLLGRFNIDNLLAVAGVLLADGFALAHVADVLGRLTPVGGRMSRLGGVAGVPLVVVDYAHTPDALEQVLNTLRSHSQGKLICVFGCGGDRDRSKRPLMAACAERLADLVWITDDNPRSESGDAIVAEITAGLKQPAKAYIQRDRRLAIKEALAAACQADIVLIAGKGHETYQEVGGVKTPFDDRAVAAGFLKVAA